MTRPYFLIACLSLLGCKKFLTEKPNGNTYSPTMIIDYRQMLDENLMIVNSTPGLGILAANDYYLTSAGSSAVGAVIQGAASWQPSVYQPSSLIDRAWSGPYDAINVCNQVLAGMEKMAMADRQPMVDYNAVLGTALFYRAFHYYRLEETYGQLYDPSSSYTSLGVVLRLSTDVASSVPRCHADTIYGAILGDLKRAVSLLPPGVQSFHNRPGQPAAWALLTQVLMTLGNYPQAELYADSCIGQYNALIDYNNLQPALTGSFPFPDSLNTEILFQCSATDYASAHLSQMLIDTGLYNSYASNDLRQTLYFKPVATTTTTPAGSHSYYGSYTGNHYFFSGLSLDAVYLYRAECRALEGDVDRALDDLNMLLSRRYKTGYYLPHAGLSQTNALLLIHAEERKELVFREQHWADLRRLNFQVPGMSTLYRSIAGQSYTLAPFANGYAFQLPEAEIAADKSPQNP